MPKTAEIAASEPGTIVELPNAPIPVTQTPEELSELASLRRKIREFEADLKTARIRHAKDLEELTQAHDIRRRITLRADDWKWKAIQQEERSNRLRMRLDELEAFSNSSWLHRMWGFRRESTSST